MNELIHESSPYLLQHSKNPIFWKAWNKETLELAQKENKLILISIGYASCHWCHVMEKQCFEDELVADVLNQNYVAIKVDREERPDVDMLYMNAVQLMTGSGGWPLNVIALPDGRPFWGGTYFRKQDFINYLNHFSELYVNQFSKIFNFARKLEKGVIDMNFPLSENSLEIISKNNLSEAVKNLAERFDSENGGFNWRQKFMMPSSLQFLLRYAFQNQDKKLMEFINLTLTKMAYGGIYDQIGGGFSRYSVDTEWHVPHFEKMLYDNAQLISLYSNAYKINKNPLYKDVVFETIHFIESELTHQAGIYCSSLDADSLNENGTLEEGAFYVWQKEELQKIVGNEDWDWFQEYFNVNEKGFWEHGKYILVRDSTLENISKKYDLNLEFLIKKLNSIKVKLFKEREKKPKPRLDDKCLTSWNALMLKAYLDAYTTFWNEQHLEKALSNAQFLENQIQEEGSIYHSYKNGKSSIHGYLEDYATVIQSFIHLYEVSGNQHWLNLSNQLAEYCIQYFYNKESNSFYFTSSKHNQLFTRNIDLVDNVIPSANSIMAKNLLKLYYLIGNQEFLAISEKMLKNVSGDLVNNGFNYTNWLELSLNFTHPFYQIAISGDNASTLSYEFLNRYLPNVLIAFSIQKSDVNILKNRYISGETLIYVCEDNSCKLPEKQFNNAFENIKLG